MIKNCGYVNIREVLNRILRHPLLQEVSIEQAAYYTLLFIGKFGMPAIYEDKEVTIDIADYRGALPEDLIQVIQVKDTQSQRCLRATTNNFKSVELASDYKDRNSGLNEFTFKTQGQVIFTSFKTGQVIISYKSIPVDTEGYPLLIDNQKYLRALELFIKKELFTVLFDEGKISMQVLQHTEQQYGWAAGQLQSEFNTPSLSEMEALKNIMCTLVQRTSDFSSGFKYLGSQEHIRLQ